MVKRSLPRHKLFVLAILACAALTPFLMPLDKHRQTETIGFAAMVPQQIDGWQLVRTDTPKELEGTAFLNEMYQGLFYDQERGYLLLTLEYSSDSRRKYELHFPVICQAARGDEVVEYPGETLTMRDGVTQPVAFMSWLQPNKEQGAFCAYWYVVGGEATSNTVRLKVKQLFAGLLHKPEKSIMVRIDALYGEMVTESARRTKRQELQRFILALYNQLEDHSRGIFYGS